MRIYLEFSPTQLNVHRTRIRYAFSLFCAICGHDIVTDAEADSAEVWISYLSADSDLDSERVLRLSSLYETRSPREAAPAPTKYNRDSETTVLFYPPISGLEPDWLAEIFEWVSCADEYSIEERDSVGRIDFCRSYMGRYHLDPRIPYAAVAMEFLQKAIQRCVPKNLHEPQYPSPRMPHFVINTHDVDILPGGYFHSLYRLLKYSLISLFVFKSPRHAAAQIGRTVRMALGGRNPLDQTANVARREIESGVGATYFFITRQGHRRDANYSIDDTAVQSLMNGLDRHGMEIALHGSYTSLDRPDGLDSEFKSLEELNFQPKGNRQHWLRFTLDRLIPEVEKTGALYDSSLGWDRAGFRAGACFAFPPYNFEFERPATFLEIPLTVMEIGQVSGGLPQNAWSANIVQTLQNSRRYGWGGISLLWHPTAFGGGQLPREIERIYWDLVDHRHEWNDTWISARDFVRIASNRYIKAGLLQPSFGADKESELLPETVSAK